MPIIHQETFKQDLAKYQTWITDSNPTSTYFQLAQIPDILTSGRNAFLINGSTFLNQSTEVKIDLVDSNGNVIFTRPIKNYNEGKARVVSIDIYETTASGLATLTILGEITQTSNGDVVPDEWKKKYNVKWQKQINVDLTRPNTTPIRLYKTPMISVSESLMQYRPTTLPTASIAGGALLTGYVLSNPGVAPIYTVNLSNITNPSTKFSRALISGTITAVIGSNTYTASINTIANDSTAFMSVPYVSGGFATTNFTMSYTDTAAFASSSLMRSFAILELDNLRTFSGKIHRAKISVKGVDSTTDYETLAEAIVEPMELTVTQSVSGTIVQIGDIHNQTTVDQYWTYAPITSTSLYTG